MTRKMNYFIEGLQGAGKSTLVKRLSDVCRGYRVFREGDYSPIELAWCAYMTQAQYEDVLKKYPALRKEIKEKTVAEGGHKIICYTQILTDIPGFHKDLERFEIYNGNLDRERFENVICERFQNWREEGEIFECSIFQNIVENQMLYLMMSDDEIMEFYRKLQSILDDRPYRIIYLDVDDITAAIDVIRKERSDDKGNELWFPLMLSYLQESPYGKKHDISGVEGLLFHLKKRQDLEHRLINEIFTENAVVVKAKNYVLEEIASAQ